MGLASINKEWRGHAISTARSIFRERGEDPKENTAESAIAVLDDELRKCRDGEMPYGICWYENASDKQVSIFCREWESWRKSR